MKKIKTVFKIDRNVHLATDEIQEDWVMRGEGIATVKIDGTSTRIDAGKLYKRFDAKHGKNPPEGFIPAEEAPDVNTGHWPGWVLVDSAKPENKWHIEAFEGNDFEDGTYELIGPKIQGNKYNLTKHELVKHGSIIVEVGRTKEEMIKWLEDNHHEGLVFHHEDERMAKLRRKDFGIKW